MLPSFFTQGMARSPAVLPLGSVDAGKAGCQRKKRKSTYLNSTSTTYKPLILLFKAKKKWNLSSDFEDNAASLGCFLFVGVWFLSPVWSLFHFLFYLYNVGSPLLPLFCFSQLLAAPLESTCQCSWIPQSQSERIFPFVTVYGFFGLNSVFGNKPCSAFRFELLSKPVI